MRLSMWMIANRLTSLDLETEIEEEAPVILKSARRAYATNCVQVYQEKDAAVCNGEGNIIRLRNMDVTQAFEIIQSVFDFYEDWFEQLLQLVREKNYQGVINQAWMVFHNPLILLDGNNKVLGLSDQYDSDAVDAEWKYLCEYGYSSLNAIQFIRYNSGGLNFDQPQFQRYHFAGSNQLLYGGASYCMYCNEIICGRVNLLEMDRKLNAGDYQLLDKLCTILEPALGQQYYETFLRNDNVFNSVLSGTVYDEENLKQQLNYQQWRLDDTYQLALVRMKNCELEEDSGNQMDVLLNTILHQQPKCVVLRKSPYIVILMNEIITVDRSMMRFLEMLADSNSLQVSFSLPCQGLLETSYLLEQGKAALRYGTPNKPEQVFYYFFDYAVDYIIETVPLIRCTHACHPGVQELWNLKEANEDEMFDTLKAYLDHERSVTRAAAALFIHRNTTIYRVKKIQKILNTELEDAYVRDYIRLSIRVLELYGRK